MFDLAFDADRGHARLHGEPVIFHCNHYNAFLQRTILDPDYIDCRELLADAASVALVKPLREIAARMAQPTPQAILERARQFFAYCGFGLLNFAATTPQGGQVTSETSHYSRAWLDKFGAASEPVAFFDAGFISAAMSVAHGRPLGHYRVKQTLCTAMGASVGRFQIELDSTRDLQANPDWSTNEALAPARSMSTPVDEPAIVGALASMPIEGNAEGLIPAFGVVLTRMAADYYNRISFEFERRLEQATGEKSLGSMLLVEAGHSCAFNTFGGVMTSAEWKALIQPMCKRREDWVHGIISAVNAFGWGVWRVQELRAGELLRVRIHGGYESNGYKSMFGSSDTPKSHLATGAVAGIMNLLWHLDITQGPALTEQLYQTEFTRPGSFVARQTACRAMGAEYDEFVAERG